MARVRAYVEAARSEALKQKPERWTQHNIYPEKVAKDLNIPLEDVTSVLDEMVGQPQPLVSPRVRGGWNRHGPLLYPMTGMPLPPLPPWKPESPKPRKQRPSWNSGKKKALAAIRREKSWVIEKFWPEPDNRYFLYMEACTRDPSHHKHGCNDESEVKPEDQPHLSRTMLARWHFTIDEAVVMCGKLRRKFPKETFRTRDTSAGDYLMGAIL